MNILVVSPILPSPLAGASTRNYQLLKALASEHSVTLLSLVSNAPEGMPVDLSHLKPLTGDVQVFASARMVPKRWQQLAGVLRGTPYILHAFRLPELQRAVAARLNSGRFDAVFFESVLIADFTLPAGVKAIIDEHNLEYELRLRTYQREKAWLRKWYNWLEGRALKPVEIERCRRADVVLVTSERERQALKQSLPESRIEIVPNGVDVDFFACADTADEVPERLIFTGALDYYPNIDAVLFFARHCWPLIHARLPGATWQIVGKNPPAQVQSLRSLPGVTVIGSVPDMRPYFAAAALAIAPIRIGSGTRLKILEAFAMRKAVVSTSIGCEGLEIEAGRHLLIADQAQAMAQAVVTLLQDAGRRSELAAAGRALVEARYSWQKSGDYLLEALATCTRQPSLQS